jgi:hypothetical protein
METSEKSIEKCPACGKQLEDVIEHYDSMVTYHYNTGNHKYSIPNGKFAPKETLVIKCPSCLKPLPYDVAMKIEDLLPKIR